MNHNIPIPERMAHLPRDARGYPEFYMVWRDQQGVAHFTINDEAKRQEVILDDLCSICGVKLLRGRWFVGGPLSAFHSNGAYLDPPMHHECLTYALQVCPYLAMRKYTGRIDDAKVSEQERRNQMFLDPTMIAERPEVFVAVLARAPTIQVWDEIEATRFVRYVRPSQPYIRTEFWRHGQAIDAKEAWQFIK